MYSFYGIFSGSNVEVLKQLIREQFYYLVTMIDVSPIVREIPELRYMLNDKPETFLLQILMFREKFIPAMIKQIQSRKPDVYETLKAKMSPIQKLAAEKHLCDKCSSTSYFQFLSECPDVMGVSIELFQTGHIEPEDLLSLYSCSTKKQQSARFCEISRHRFIDFAHFTAAVLNMTEKNKSEAKNIIQKLNDVLCEDLRSTFNLVPILQEERKITVAIESNKSKTNIPQSKSKKQSTIRNQETKQDFSNSTSSSTVFAVVKLQRGNGQHFERSFVETLINRKDKINSEIESYGKIERVHLGCIELILQLRGESDDKSKYYTSINNILQHIMKDRCLQTKLDDANMKLEWKVNLDDKQMAEKGLWKRKIFIISKYEYLRSEINILSFVKEFGQSNIMDEATFEERFEVECPDKDHRSELFLNFILQSGIEVMEAFLKVLKEDSIYKYVARCFDRFLDNIRHANEYDANEITKIKEECNEGMEAESNNNTAEDTLQESSTCNKNSSKTKENCRKETCKPQMNYVKQASRNIDGVIPLTSETDLSRNNDMSRINITNYVVFHVTPINKLKTVTVMDSRKTYNVKSDIAQFGDKNTGNSNKIHNGDEEEEEVNDEREDDDEKEEDEED